MKKFDNFIIFAEMRTGSNFLESNLDQFPGIKCYGEAFNPYFLKTPKMKELFGVTVPMRDADPMRLINQMKKHAPGTPGFRFFHDHDPRVFEALIDDPRCAKVVLTRNLMDAYVSRKIAWETNQWQLNDVKDAKKQKVRFVPEEFEKLFYRMKAFQLKIKTRLQISGQSAFYIDYEDIQNIDVINGLAKFLGETETITKFSGTFKKQNPEALSEKVDNFDELERTAGNIDLFDLHRIPNFEPSRPPAVTSYFVAQDLPLVFLPIKGGPQDTVVKWLSRFGEIQNDFTQKMLRQWKNHNPGHRGFTVIRHPLARLHASFCRYLVGNGPETYGDIRHALRDHYDVPLPLDLKQENWDIAQHRHTFEKFIDFVEINHQGLTSLRIDSGWATQSSLLSAFSGFAHPDFILREENLQRDLDHIGATVGATRQCEIEPELADSPFLLSDIYDAALEKRVKKLFRRDYMQFGFDRWNSQA